MANYKRMRGRSDPQRRRSSSGGILKTLGAVLVVFLVIGLLGSLFSRSYVSADADKNNPTEPVELITFTVDGVTYHCEAGMTWNDFLVSDYNDRFVLAFDDRYVNDNTGAWVTYYDDNDVSVGDKILAGEAYLLRKNS